MPTLTNVQKKLIYKKYNTISINKFYTRQNAVNVKTFLNITTIQKD